MLDNYSQEGIVWGKKWTTENANQSIEVHD